MGGLIMDMGRVLGISLPRDRAEAKSKDAAELNNSMETVNDVMSKIDHISNMGN